MPYGGTTKSQDKRIERCVKRLMSEQNKSKESAIRICKTSVLGRKKKK